MPGWEMRLWDDTENVNLMERHLPQFSARFKNIRLGVVRADIARCLYLYAHGGVYLDTDYKLLRPLSQELLLNECVLPASRDADPSSPRFRVGNAVLASEPGHKLWKCFLTDIFANTNLEDLPENLVEKVTGPEGLTECFLRHGECHSRVHIPEKEFFHPKITWQGLGYDRRCPAYGVHLCWGSWRSRGLLSKAKILFARKLSSL
jgi:mannosyltransferase OCH1-like enzyme